VPDVESLPPAVDGLDPGEQQALAIALGLPGAFVLVDDGVARRVARAERVPLIGTLGLIAVAKAAGLCPSAREKYELLLTKRFRLDVLGCLTVSSTVVDPTSRAPRLAHVLAWAEFGAIRPYVSHVFPLPERKRALRAKWKGEVIGECVLHPCAWFSRAASASSRRR
jgi:hypothetical protein